MSYNLRYTSHEHASAWDSSSGHSYPFYRQFRTRSSCSTRDAVLEARDDVIVRVMSEDVEGVSEKRGNTPWGKLAFENLDDDGYHTASDEDEESAHFPTTRPPKPVPSKKTSTRPKKMTPVKIKAIKIIMSAGHLTAAVLWWISTSRSKIARPLDPGRHVLLPTSPASTLTAQVADILTYSFPRSNG